MKRIALAALVALALAAPVEARTSHHHKVASQTVHHGATHKKPKVAKTQRRKAHHARVAAKAKDRHAGRHVDRHARKHAEKAVTGKHRHGAKASRHSASHATSRHAARHSVRHRASSRHRAVHHGRTHGRTHASTHANTHISRRHRATTSHVGATHAMPTYRTPHYDAPVESSGSSFNNAFRDIRPGGDNH